MSSASIADLAPDPTAPDRAALPYHPALDGVRALSVLAVIAYHNGYSWAVGGFLGVDAFFVLSGFLITTLLVLEYRRVATVGLVAFWGRRLRRLLPALLLVLGFAAIYGSIALRPYEVGRLRWDSVASVFYVTNWRFIASGQSYFDLFSTPSPLRHLWSLAIEEQFYLVWPLVVLGCLRVRRGAVDLLAAVCVVGAVASATAMAVLYDPEQPSRAYYGTDTRAHGLLIGALLALLLLRGGPTRPVTRRMLQGGTLAAGVAIFWCWHVVDATSAGYYGLGSVGYALAVAVVIAGVMQSGITARILGAQPWRGIGQISYGLYLWHWPIIVWLVHWRVGFGGSALVALRLVVTFAAAIASYSLVEQPIRHGRWFPRGSLSARLATPVAVAVMVVVLLGATVGASAPPSYFTGGKPSPCFYPNAAERRAAQRALARRDAADLRDLPRIAVVGDSVGCSLWPGLAAVQDADGLRYQMGATIACGVVSDHVLASATIPLAPAETDTCNLLARDRRRGAVTPNTDAVLWMSSWERADLDDDGERAEAGTSRWKDLLTKRMTATLDELTRGGAHVVIVTMPPKTEGEIRGLQERPSTADDASYGQLNDLLLAVAAEHPEQVTLVDLAGHVCPGGAPCPRMVDGLVPRGFDGAHFTPQGSVWALEWLLPEIARATAAGGPGA